MSRIKVGDIVKVKKDRMRSGLSSERVYKVVELIDYGLTMTGRLRLQRSDGRAIYELYYADRFELVKPKGPYLSNQGTECWI